MPLHSNTLFHLFQLFTTRMKALEGNATSSCRILSKELIQNYLQKYFGKYTEMLKLTLVFTLMEW